MIKFLSTSYQEFSLDLTQAFINNPVQPIKTTVLNIEIMKFPAKSVSLLISKELFQIITTDNIMKAKGMDEQFTKRNTVRHVCLFVFKIKRVSDTLIFWKY